MSEVEATQAPIVLADLGKEALRDLLGNLTQAKAFVLEQAPEFCQQLVARDMGLAIFLSGLLLTLSVIAFAIGGISLWLYHKHGRDDDYAPGTIIGFVIGGFAVFCACNCAYEALYIHLAPKVYLVEQLMRMVK